MLEPIKVQEIGNCVIRMNNLLHTETSDNYSEQIMELTQENFTNSTDYRKVYKNFDYTNTYDTWIYEGNDEDKIVGYKYLQSYPYNTPQFKIGDYVHWNFNHKNLSTWILTSLDTQYLYNVKGRMLECNNSLRWKSSDGELNCYPCVIKDAMTYTNFRWGNRGVVQNSGDIVVIVQKNKETSEIQINDRFLFNEIAFRVKQFLDELNPNYMELYMMKASELEGDNFKDNVAINEEPAEKENLEGNVLQPNISEIKLNDTIEFNVYNYLRGRKQEDTFEINIKNVPKNNYELNIINGNKFTIKNVKEYQIKPMSVICKNLTSGEEITQTIWLGGNW